MTDQEIDALWNKGVHEIGPSHELLRKVARAVAAAEREACAKVADDADKSTHPADIADAIRKRGAL